jgi:hypothetical protein
MRLLRTLTMAALLTQTNVVWAQGPIDATSYGVWWELPYLQEGTVRALLQLSSHCPKADKKSVIQVTSEFWRFGQTKPELWAKPVSDVFAVYCEG